MKVVPLIVLDRLNMLPFGWVSCADTINSERSDSNIAEFNSIVQVRVTVDIDGLLVTDTEAGAGTEGKKSRLLNFMALLSLYSY